MNIPRYALLHAAFFTPVSRGWGLPILLWGAPGVAKTAAMKALARRFNAYMERLSPGERGEGQFGVVPVPAGEGRNLALTYPAPAWVDSLVNQSGVPYGLVLVDELTTAPPALQPALLGLALEGAIGGATLGRGVRIMAAANPVGDAANGYDLPPPAANRFVHIDWHLTAADFCAYMLGQASDNDEQVSADIEANRVLGVWPEAFAKASAKVAAFIARHPDLLHKMPAENDPNRGRAWPSPRSWEMAARCLASADVHGLSEVDRDTLGAGCVGDAAWGEFCDYMSKLDLPDPAQILDRKLAWQPQAARLDITMAVLQSCVALVTPERAPHRYERATALWGVLDTVAKSGATDLIVGPAKALMNAKLLDRVAAMPVLAYLTKAGFSKVLQG